MKRIIFAAAAFLSLIPFVGADEPAKQDSDYFISEPDLALNLVSTRQNYTVEIDRVHSGQQTVALLKKAEALYPKREKVWAASRDAHFKLSQSLDIKEPLWWSSSFDGVRIPYAITAGAVTYYQKLIQDFMKGDFSGSGNIKMTNASLKYTASIKQYAEWTYEKQDFKDVYVADMVLSWSQYCGNLCAMGFTKKRLVVLDKDGNVRAVFGDGNTGTVVS